MFIHAQLKITGPKLSKRSLSLVPPPILYLCSIRKLSNWNSGDLNWVDSVIPCEVSSRMWIVPCPDLPCTKAVLLVPSLPHISTPGLSFHPFVALFILDFLLKAISCHPVFVTLCCSIFNKRFLVPWTIPFCFLYLV